jgi:hypothetical protein
LTRHRQASVRSGITDLPRGLSLIGRQAPQAATEGVTECPPVKLRFARTVSTLGRRDVRSVRGVHVVGSARSRTGLDPYRVSGPWDPRTLAGAVVADALRATPWECVVVGGGVRTAEGRVEVFEQVINLVPAHGPDGVIAFNSTPTDTFAAAARWIDVP